MLFWMYVNGGKSSQARSWMLERTERCSLSGSGASISKNEDVSGGRPPLDGADLLLHWGGYQETEMKAD